MDEKEEWGARAKLFTPEIKKLRLQIKVWEKWNKDIKNEGGVYGIERND